MLVSLFENNRNNVINVFVLIPKDMQECLLGQIMKSVTKFSQNLHFYSIDVEILKELRLVKYATSTVYFKLLMGEVLPKTIRKVLYLDADIFSTGGHRRTLAL